MEIIIGVIVTISVGYAIFKGYPTTGILFIGGIVLLCMSVFMGKDILPADVKTTGNTYLDIVEFLKFLLTSRAGGLGMMIMTLVGFATYMTHIGANDVVVKLMYKPLKYIKSPYFLMVGVYFIACAMGFVINSATALGVLLMATMFPIMVNCGISRGAAVAICASPSAMILSPTSGDTMLAAQASGLNIIDFTFKTIFPISALCILAMGIAHFFWQRYLDKKYGTDDENSEKIQEKLEEKELDVSAPSFYFIFPFLPIIGVFIFRGKIAPEINMITIIILAILLTVTIEFLRKFDLKAVLLDLNVLYRGMADAFANVVILLVAAGFFVQGLSSIGFVNALIDSVNSGGTGGVVMMLMLSLITIIVTVATGSGNAIFFSFIELIPKLATQMGINPAYLAIPMLQSSNLGRIISPVSAVVVAVSGMAKISPLEIIKRTSVPALVGFITLLVCTHIMIAM